MWDDVNSSYHIKHHQTVQCKLNLYIEIIPHVVTQDARIGLIHIFMCNQVGSKDVYLTAA